MLVRCPQLAPCGARLLDINKVFVVGEYTFHDISKMILINAYHCIVFKRMPVFRLLVLLPSASNLSLTGFPPLLMASFTSFISKRYSNTSLMLRRKPSPFLALV